LNRYETFVIRVWIGREPRIDHGEIRHLATGQRVRFQQLRDAVTFMEEQIDAGHRADAANPPPAN